MVFPAKYRQKVFTGVVSDTLCELCLEISKRYEIHFVEIGMDDDHVHFLIQSVPVLSVTRIVTIIKSVTAKRIFERHKEVKQLLWGGRLWTSGYYANTVSEYANAEGIKKYIANQASYKKILVQQLTFEL
jgi:REP element-mobilizing transposase RayT